MKKKELALYQKCMFAFLLVVFCRILAGIPTPFVNRDYFNSMTELSNALGFMNLLSGNGLSSLSLMALGITPYITASIVLQLMGVVIPRIEELRKGMSEDREKLERITVILGCVLSFMQGIGMSIGFGKNGMLLSAKWYVIILVSCIWMLGTLTESLIGKFITDKLIGNGISMILLANILSAYPSDAYSLYSRITVGRTAAVAAAVIAAVLVGIFLMFMFVVFVEGCEKRIPITYTQKVSNFQNSKIVSNIPIKLCPGSVVPVIFASSIFALPGMIAAITGKTAGWLNLFNTTSWFNTSYEWYWSIGALIYVAMIFGFSYYYVSLEINPIQVASDIKNGGGIIPGIRPGRPTSDYIRRQMKYTIFIGAAALSVIAMVPIILGGLFSIPRVSFLGTSIIIVCGVILELRKAITSEMVSTNRPRNRKGRFLNG
jgi:preprotein translocase subunit SecY